MAHMPHYLRASFAEYLCKKNKNVNNLSSNPKVLENYINIKQNMFGIILWMLSGHHNDQREFLAYHFILLNPNRYCKLQMLMNGYLFLKQTISYIMKNFERATCHFIIKRVVPFKWYMCIDKTECQARTCHYV